MQQQSWLYHKMCIMQSAVSIDEVRTQAMKKYGMRWQQLRNIVRNKSLWENVVQKMKLSKVSGLKKLTASKFEKKTWRRM